MLIKGLLSLFNVALNRPAEDSEEERLILDSFVAWVHPSSDLLGQC